MASCVGSICCAVGLPSVSAGKAAHGVIAPARDVVSALWDGVAMRGGSAARVVVCQRKVSVLFVLSGYQPAKNENRMQYVPMGGYVCRCVLNKIVAFTCRR
jgi:hypothetical protein